MDRRIKQVLSSVIVCLIVVSLLIAGCAQQPAPTPTPAPAPAPKAEPIKLRYSGGLPPTHHITVEQKWFAEEVGKRTGGAVVVEAYVASELYHHGEVIDAVSTGAIEMGFSTGGFLSQRNPVHGFYNYFFLQASQPQYERAKDRLAQVLWPLLERDNLKPLNWLLYGETGYAGKKSLVDPGDINGLLLNGPNPPTNAFIKLLGAVPAPMASTEVYDAMSKGAIDGAFSGWSTFYSRKWYEVADHFSGPFQCSTWITFMNLDTWNSLPKDIQQTIMEVAKDTENMSFEQGKAYDSKAKETLAKSGTLTVFSSEQIAAWVDFVRPHYQSYIDKSEKAGSAKEVAEVLKILDDTR